MTQEQQQWEKELKEAGWQPMAVHPNSPMWRAPDGKTVYPGPGYAWTVMKRAQESQVKVEEIINMSQPQTQTGYVYLGQDGKAFHIRYNVHENGVRKQRSRKLCLKNDLHPSKDAPTVLALAEEFIATINNANSGNDAQPGHKCPICGNKCRRTIEQKFASK